MQRIALIGSGGAGKSTLAMQLSQILGIEVVHLDTLFWQPGWTPTPREEWQAIQEELVRRTQWIIDGNYSATMETRLAAADTVIYLDMPNWLCLWRAVKRRIMYAGRTRPDMAPGCPEQLDWAFLKWIWQYPATRRPAMLKRLEALGASTRVIHLRSPREVDAFLKQVGQQA